MENFKHIQERGEHNKTSHAHHSASTILYPLHSCLFPLQMILKLRYHLFHLCLYMTIFTIIPSAYFLRFDYLSLIKDTW